jgi:hypothetical protein
VLHFASEFRDRAVMLTLHQQDLVRRFFFAVSLLDSAGDDRMSRRLNISFKKLSLLILLNRVISQSSSQNRQKDSIMSFSKYRGTGVLRSEFVEESVEWIFPIWD